MTLANTAAALRRSADRQPGRTFPHQLERGLKLTIRRDGEQLTVEAARLGVLPSDKEAQIVAAVFCVPKGVTPSVFVGAQWDGLRWQWEEAAPPALPVLVQARLPIEEPHS